MTSMFPVPSGFATIRDAAQALHESEEYPLEKAMYWAKGFARTCETNSVYHRTSDNFYLGKDVTDELSGGNAEFHLQLEPYFQIGFSGGTGIKEPFPDSMVDEWALKISSFEKWLGRNYRPFEKLSGCLATFLGDADKMGSAERSKGGRPPKWDWKRARYVAFAHFEKNGFVPSSADRETSINQIAEYIVNFLNKGAGSGGQSLKRSDARKHAEDVYESYQAEIDQKPTRA